jgi:hypothetical protein
MMSSGLATFCATMQAVVVVVVVAVAVLLLLLLQVLAVVVVLLLLMSPAGVTSGVCLQLGSIVGKGAG